MNPFLVPVIMTQFLPLAVMVGLILPAKIGLSVGAPYDKVLFICVIITVIGYGFIISGLL